MESTDFISKVSVARKKEALRNLQIITVIASLFTCLGFVTPGYGNPLQATLRFNNIVTMVFLFLTVGLARRSAKFLHRLDIPLTFIFLHIIAYNSLTYSRLKALYSPAFDHVVVESKGNSDEIECILLCCLCVSGACHFCIMDVKAACVVALVAPLCWTLQVLILGSELSGAGVFRIIVMYFALSAVDFLGLRSHRAVLLLAQWEIGGLGNRKQQKANCDIMNFMCDCVVSLTSTFHIREECPKLSALCLQPEETVNAHSCFLDYVNSASDIQIMQETLHGGLEVGMFLLCLKDASKTRIRVHAYYSRFQDEMGQTCYLLGLIEVQEDKPLVSARARLASKRPDATGSSACVCCESDSEDEIPAQTLSTVESVCHDEGSMQMTLDTHSMLIMNTSEALKDFIHTSLENEASHQLRKVNNNSIQGLRNNLAGIAAKCSEIETNLGDLHIKLPTGAYEQGADYDRVLRVERCHIETLTFLSLGDGSVEKFILAGICLNGKKEILRRQSRKRRGRKQSHMLTL